MKERDIANFVMPLYNDNKDSMHNFKHILRIKKKIILLKKPYKKINEEKLRLLIYFHGLKDWVNSNNKIFFKLGFSKNDILLINRHTKNPKTIEEKLIYDANLLENVGKFGIKKALIVGGELGRTKNETINYISTNLKKVKFYTIIGKKLGNEEIKITKEFIKHGKI
ncbi:Uncharacterised protein [uncultured archaeon]|nr:Uncharacterised protein [uncultured archaeon]